MNHVRVTTITGHEVDIPHEEALRVTNLMTQHQKVDGSFQHMKERNTHYHKKALDGIHEIAERNGYFHVGDTENELKELLSDMLDAHPDLGDLIVEIVEERIAKHFEEVSE
jgi:hypothetical protein